MAKFFARPNAYVMASPQKFYRVSRIDNLPIREQHSSVLLKPFNTLACTGE